MSTWLHVGYAKRGSEKELSKNQFDRTVEFVGGRGEEVYHTCHTWMVLLFYHGREPLCLIPNFRSSALAPGPYINLPHGVCQVPGTFRNKISIVGQWDVADTASHRLAYATSTQKFSSPSTLLFYKWGLDCLLSTMSTLNRIVGAIDQDLRRLRY